MILDRNLYAKWGPSLGFAVVFHSEIATLRKKLYYLTQYAMIKFYIKKISSVCTKVKKSCLYKSKNC